MKAVRSILDITTGENLAAIGENGRPDAKPAVRAISLSCRLAGRGDQIGSSQLVDLHDRVPDELRVGLANGVELGRRRTGQL